MYSCLSKQSVDPAIGAPWVWQIVLGWLIRLRRIAFLDLEQISADFEIEHFETVSSDYIFLSSRSEY
jgi:hypothetical protein